MKSINENDNKKEDINSLTEKDQIAIIKLEPWKLLFLKEPSEMV